jgi:hypothetical protein
MAILAGLFVWVALSAFAQYFPNQEYIDTVVKKDGSELRGIVVENRINEYIRIELAGGSIFRVEYKEIASIGKIKNPSFSAGQQPGSGGTNIVVQNTQTPTAGIAALPSSNNSLQQGLYFYERQKKSPLAAGLWSFFLPSAGHAYAGKWGRGLLFFLGEVVLMSTAMTLGMDEVSTSYNPYSYDYSYTVEPNGIYWLSYIGIVGLRIWELVDAVKVTNSYNNDLYMRFVGQ